MLTINLIREKKDFIIERLKVKNFKAEEIIARILELDTSAAAKYNQNPI